MAVRFTRAVRVTAIEGVRTRITRAVRVMAYEGVPTRVTRAIRVTVIEVIQLPKLTTKFLMWD